MSMIGINNSIWHRTLAGAAFSPTDISGLTIWLDGQDNSTILDSGGSPCDDTDECAEWQDKSGNDYHLTSPSGKRPTYNTSVDVFSLPGLDFEFGKYMLRTTDQIHDATSTVFIAWSLRDPNAARGGSVWGGGSGTPDVSGRQNAFAPLGSYVAGVGQDVGLNIGSVCVVNYNFSEKQYSTFEINGANSYHYKNGVASAVGNPGTFSNVGLSIGANYLGGATLDTVFCEVIVYDSVLSASERATVEAYLASKWGI